MTKETEAETKEETCEEICKKSCQVTCEEISNKTDSKTDSRELTCIVCPNGCLLEAVCVEGIWQVTGNQCARGSTFAVEEITHPMRTVSTTVRTIFPEVPVLPVRVSKEIPKERIFDVKKEINQITVQEVCGTKEILIKNVLGLGADVIVTSNILKELRRENC